MAQITRTCTRCSKLQLWQSRGCVLLQLVCLLPGNVLPITSLLLLLLWVR